MQTLGSRILSVVFVDAEMSMAYLSGAFTDILVNRRKTRRAIPLLLNALVAGFLVSRFVTPGIVERFNLSKAEAVAAAFVVGYTGVRTLAIIETTLHKKIIAEYRLKRQEQRQRITGSSKLSSSSADSSSTTTGDA